MDRMKINTIAGDRLTPDHISAWSRLQRADAAVDSPFFRPEYTSIVSKFRDDIEVAVLEENGEYVGFFPFQKVKRNVGRAVAWRLSDFHGLIIKKGVALDAKTLMRNSGLSTWHFDHLVTSQKPFQPYHTRVEDSAYMDLREGYEVYKNQRRQAGSSTILQGMRKSRKIAREIGPLRFDWHTTDSSVFEALLTWKRIHLKHSPSLDIFRFKWVIDILQSIRFIQTEKFAAMLSTLYAGDHLISVHLGLRSYHVFSSWIPSYDPDYKKYSPGLIHHIEMAKKAAEVGIKRIDLGRGNTQLMKSLCSGVNPVAIGSVDLHPIKRILRTGWYRTRDLIHATPLRGMPLRIYRDLRSYIAHD